MCHVIVYTLYSSNRWPRNKNKNERTLLTKAGWFFSFLFFLKLSSFFLPFFLLFVFFYNDWFFKIVFLTPKQCTLYWYIFYAKAWGRGVHIVVVCFSESLLVFTCSSLWGSQCTVSSICEWGRWRSYEQRLKLYYFPYDCCHWDVHVNWIVLEQGELP